MLIALIFLVGISPVDTFDFTLEQAIDYALMNNPEIEQSTIEFEKSKTQTSQALSAFYPSITASGSYAYVTDIPVIDFEGVPVPLGQSENYNLSISLQQVLFSWGKIYNAYKISDIGKKIAELTLVRKKQELRYSVTDVYYGLLVLEKMVAIARESLLQLKRHEDVVTKRYKAGLVPQFDVLRAQVQVANLKPQLIKTENGLRLAKEGFKMLLGMPLEEKFTITGTLDVSKDVFDLDTLIHTALEQRIELKSLKGVEEIAKLNQKIIRRTNLPTIVGGATYNRTMPFGFAGDEWGSNITFNIGFQWPLFTGFNTLAQHRQASLEIREAQLAYENLEKAITLEVKQGYLNFLAAYEALTTARDNVGQAEKAFVIIEKRYKNGLATNLEYLDTQLALMQAKANYLSALQVYHTSSADIYKAIGKEE